MFATDAPKQVKKTSKGDTATAKAAPTDKHEAVQGSAKQKEEKKSHTTEAFREWTHVPHGPVAPHFL